MSYQELIATFGWWGDMDHLRDNCCCVLEVQALYFL